MLLIFSSEAFGSKYVKEIVFGNEHFFYLFQANCSHFELFPPGHYYVGKSLHGEVKGEMKPFYHSKWFNEINYVPDHPLDLAEFRGQLCASV